MICVIVIPPCLRTALSILRFKRNVNTLTVILFLLVYFTIKTYNKFVILDEGIEIIMLGNKEIMAKIFLVS